MQQCWYVDDGYFAGAEDDLFQALAILTVTGAECGLELRKENFEWCSVESMNKIDSLISMNSLDGN